MLQPSCVQSLWPAPDSWLSSTQLSALREGACEGAEQLYQGVLALMGRLFVPQRQRPSAAKLAEDSAELLFALSSLCGSLNQVSL